MYFRSSGELLPALIFSVAICGAAPAESTELSSSREHAKTDPRLEPCIKSINAVGASLGHRERKGTEEKPILDFLVRANGSDYRIACEMESGFLKDIAPNVVHLGDTN
jgi:hypothetical protein